METDIAGSVRTVIFDKSVFSSIWCEKVKLTGFEYQLLVRPGETDTNWKFCNVWKEKEVCALTGNASGSERAPSFMVTVIFAF